MEGKISHNIGVLYEDDADNGLTHDFFAAILEGFLRAVEAKGYHMCFVNTDKDYTKRKTFLDQALEEKYAGIFVPCADFKSPEVISLMSSGIPVAAIDAVVDGIVSVQSDNEGGMTELVDYLISLNHRRIAFITGEDCAVTKIRLSAYLNCMKKAGIEVPAEYIKQGKFRNINMTTFLTEELMRLPEIPSCILYPDDYAAIGGLNVLKARGFEIPSEISVAGFDGNDIMSHYEPRITTVFQNKKRLGETAAAHLMEWIENPGYKPGKPIVIDTEFKKGRSVGKVYY